jgi:hypothetical protein
LSRKQTVNRGCQSKEAAHGFPAAAGLGGRRRLFLALLAFGVREVGGVLRAIGQDLWRSYKRRRGKARSRGDEPGTA